ncbi:MAG TPA: phosphate regulon sensor histidine kinase PhoR [Burkholderiales bacterium]|nr:phosphate regulon sensor histidine kinase PhoR [Burkholderiales bacterium]
MNPVWSNTIGIAIAAAAVGLLVGAFAGPAWAWGAVAGVLALRVLYHAAHLAGLSRWLQSPQRATTLPSGHGVWEEVLAELHRTLKFLETEREELSHALLRFRAAAQALPDGVIILDREDRIEWANATARRQLGVDARRDAGSPVVNLVRHPDFVAYLRRSDYGAPLILRSTRSDAVLSIRIIEFGADRKLLSSRDVTSEEQLDTMRRDFVANVSHELKTPVTVLSGFVETLADERVELSPVQRKRFLGLMAEQSQRMRHLIEDLLTLSTLESSPTPNDEQEIDMRALCERLRDEAQALSTDHHQITVDLTSHTTLYGSETELRSAFSNLVSNAIRYSPDGGGVRIGWRVDDGHGVFSVSDNGIGIDPRDIPRLTERFYRVDRGRSRETGGTGLGLAIVKHVLTRHDATLEIESTPGQGSTFSAVFPEPRVLRGKATRAAA